MFAAVLAMPSCQINPYTGRSQLMLLDRQTELALGSQAYQEQLAQEESKITYDPVYLEPVQRIAQRLSRQMESGWGEIPPPGFQWEVHVIDDPKTANAWALPGGKIAVYTGLFPVCKDEHGLAVVLGHEIMHAVLRHGNERISQGMLTGVGTEVLAAALGRENEEKKKMLQAAIGLGASVGLLLPYSRKGETEADEFGLYLAARAGYDPREGIEVWRRMEQAGAAGVPEFLSTHPSHGTRIQNMQTWMPKALQSFEQSERQPNQPLPAPGHARRVAPPPAPANCLAPVAVNRQVVDGIELAQFQLHTQCAVYVDRVDVQGPDAATTVEAGSGIPGNEERFVMIRRTNGGGVPRGRYTLRFKGAVDGRPWEEVLQFDLR
ncbi:MAG: M48 family metallopeptidase [Planctomycetes bacterium]|nr:M48 family metallopeptidase [Planctomycetota bacterium]